MKRRTGAAGYALLAALLIVALAGVLVAAAVTAVTARQTVVAADRGGTRARWALQEGLAAVALRLRLAPADLSGSAAAAPPTGEPAPEGAPGGGGWAASWERVAAGAGAWPCVRLSARSRAGAARDSCDALLELRADPFARGVVVAGDAEFGAPAAFAGTGVYCGGSVRGREWARCTGADVVQGERWPQAAVHAAGGIWCAGVEVHAGEPPGAGEAADPLTELTAADTDTHTGEGDLADLVAAPEASLLAALREHAADPGAALAGGVLDLARLPAHAPAAAAAGGSAGYLVVLRPQDDGALRLVGERPAAWCPVAVVVLGDAVIGTATLRGAVVVCGNLRVEGPLDLGGHLFARRLATSDTMRVTVPPGWRSSPLAGLAEPVIVRLDGP